MSIAFIPGPPGTAELLVMFGLSLIVLLLVIAAVSTSLGGKGDADKRIASLERRVDELEDEQ